MGPLSMYLITATMILLGVIVAVIRYMLTAMILLGVIVAVAAYAEPV